MKVCVLALFQVSKIEANEITRIRFFGLPEMMQVLGVFNEDRACNDSVGRRFFDKKAERKPVP
jgi:hypothetical protein